MKIIVEAQITRTLEIPDPEETLDKYELREYVEHQAYEYFDNGVDTIDITDVFIINSNYV